jgi:hypothetical protein
MGYVNGAGGVPTLMDVGDGKDGKTVSRNDLIDPPGEAADVFKGKKSRRAEVEVVMFCDMIPHEYLLGGAGTGPDGTAVGDIVMDYGVYDHQPYNPYDPQKVTRPFQVNIYARAQGKIVPPLLALLKPNRFVARILGAMESQLNMAGGELTGVDIDLLAESNPTGTDVAIARKQGKPIEFHNGGMGISNAMHRFDDTTGQGTYAMLQIVMAVQDMVRTIMGVNGPMMGEEKKGQLVGVTDILVRRGMAMQEPFHGPMADNLEQQYRFLATAGKEHLVSRPDLLRDVVTDQDMLVLLESEDASLERCNATIERDNPDNTLRQQANNWLDGLLQLGMIDKGRYAALYNNSYPTEVSVAIRQYASELKQAENAQAKEQARQQMLAGLAQESQRLDDERARLDDQRAKSADMLAKEGAKERANISREDVKARHKADQTVLENELQARQQQSPVAVGTGNENLA